MKPAPQTCSRPVEPGAGFSGRPAGPDTTATGTRSKVYSSATKPPAARTLPYLNPVNSVMLRSLEHGIALGRPNDPPAQRPNSFLFVSSVESAISLPLGTLDWDPPEGPDACAWSTMEANTKIDVQTIRAH